MTHFFDQWHVAKGLVKKLLAANKVHVKGCEVIVQHIFWCSTSTKSGFHDLILAKWKSLVQHVSRKHTNHPDKLFEECEHDDNIEPRKWIKVGK